MYKQISFHFFTSYFYFILCWAEFSGPPAPTKVLALGCAYFLPVIQSSMNVGTAVKASAQVIKAPNQLT